MNTVIYFSPVSTQCRFSVINVVKTLKGRCVRTGLTTLSIDHFNILLPNNKSNVSKKMSYVCMLFYVKKNNSRLANIQDTTKFKMLLDCGNKKLAVVSVVIRSTTREYVTEKCKQMLIKNTYLLTKKHCLYPVSRRRRFDVVTTLKQRRVLTG